MNMLTVRMALYLICGAIAGMGGPVTFDAATGLLTVDINAASISIAAISLGGYVLTFIGSRIAKRNGSAT